MSMASWFISGALVEGEKHTRHKVEFTSIIVLKKKKKKNLKRFQGKNVQKQNKNRPFSA